MFQLSVITIDSGFGYEIFKNKQPYIMQTQIPAIQGTKVFVNNIEAQRIGELVLYKLEHNITPNITVIELDSLKIMR